MVPIEAVCVVEIYFTSHLKIVAKNMIKKVFSRAKMIVLDFAEKFRACGLTSAIGSLCWWLGWYLPPLKRIAFWGIDIQRTCFDKLWNTKYHEILKLYSNIPVPDETIPDEQYKIWVFGAQGFENAPDLIKLCVSVLEKYNCRRVVRLSMDNIREYIDIPEYIYDRLETGSISYTNYADILRVSLLAKYGGLWIDPTCFCVREVPENTRNRSFFSPKDEWTGNIPLWSKSRWGTYALGTNRINNPAFLFVRDIFYEYLKNNKKLLDYWMIDILLDLFSRTNVHFNSDLEESKIDTTSRTMLYKVLGNKFDENLWRYMVENSWFFKLSYKRSFPDKVDGTSTFYNKIIKQ